MSITTILKYLIALAFLNSALLITSYFMYAWAEHSGHWSEKGWEYSMNTWIGVKFALLFGITGMIAAKLENDKTK